MNNRQHNFTKFYHETFILERNHEKFFTTKVWSYTVLDEDVLSILLPMGEFCVLCVLQCACLVLPDYYQHKTLRVARYAGS